MPKLYRCEGELDDGDTSWVLICSVLVLGMMPALAFFEAGLLRSKNTLSVVTQVLAGMVVLQLMWYMFGFSLVYSDSHAGLIGDFNFGLLLNVRDRCYNTIPLLAFVLFGSNFAAITPLLMTGAFAERLKIKAVLIIVILYEVLVYYPVAHWIWNPEGWLAKFGVRDFAGGIVIHATSGSSALLISILIGRRHDFHTHHGDPHPSNLPLAGIGLLMLWIGWFGFNAGSSLSSGYVAAETCAVTAIAAAAGGFTWMALSTIHYREIRTVLMYNGVVAGLAGITPASGYVLVEYSIPMGVIIGLVSFYGIKLFKELLHIDDALDVSSVHGLSGIVGSMMIAIFATKSANPAGMNGVILGEFRGLYIQLVGIAVSVAWALFWTLVIYGIIRLTPYVRLRVRQRDEELGLDAMKHGHGHAAYHDLFPKLDHPELADEDEYEEDGATQVVRSVVKSLRRSDGHSPHASGEMQRNNGDMFPMNHAAGEGDTEHLLARREHSIQY